MLTFFTYFYSKNKPGVSQEEYEKLEKEWVSKSKSNNLIPKQIQNSIL